MNIIYKHLARSANLDNIYSGQLVSIGVDLALAHDGSMPKIMEQVSNVSQNEKVLYGNKLHVTIDHYLPAPNSNERLNYFKIKEFCRENDINLYGHGEGILHQVIAERFDTKLKSMIVVGVDGHMCTSAALGAIPFSITPAEMTNFLLTGKYNLNVPEVININLTGQFSYEDDGQNLSISGKDVALFLLGQLGSAELKGKAVLITGEALEQLSQSQKMTIANMIGEIGAKTCYFYENKDEEKEDCHKRVQIKVEDIQGFIALPGSPENVKPVMDIQDKSVTQVFIGGCTNGRIDDMEQVVKVLNGREVHEDVTLIICPASRTVANDMDRLGYSQTIRNSGGIIINPGCGPCSGIHQGVASKEDVIITTTPRNTPGRMGDEGAEIYLASPKIAAMSALEGKIMG